VYRSADLVEWTQIGNVATRPEQVDLEKVPTPGGVWAPTIRYRDGVFYVIVTVMLGGRGCVVFTATDPAGLWSDGTPIPAVTGIDPDLTWDDDGTALVTFAGFPHPSRQVRVDLATGEALEEVRTLWEGTGRYAPEGPHLYRRGEHWYLLVAEGGTDRGQRAAAGTNPLGGRSSSMRSSTSPAASSACQGGTVRLIAAGGGREVVLAEFDGRYWSFEVANSFTGRVFGLYATEGTVSFADLRYSGTDAVPG
jgi:beta-xylosidase